MNRPNREQPQCFNMYARAMGALDLPVPLAGGAGTILSHDARSGGLTALIQIPPNWIAECENVAADLELFVLEGDLALEDQAVGSGGYVHLPGRQAGATITSRTGARAIVFWTPEATNFPSPYTAPRAVRTSKVAWEPAEPGAHGLLYKPLRWPDVKHASFDGGPGGFVRLFLLPPGTADHQQHVHLECWEEVITLSGDVFMADEGLTARGTVLGHPREFFHGPFTSHSGAVLLVHTDAPMGSPWPRRDYPNGVELAEAYQDAAGWSTEARHKSWRECPQRAMADDAVAAEWHQQHPDHAAWSRPYE